MKKRKGRRNRGKYDRIGKKEGQGGKTEERRREGKYERIKKKEKK